MKNFSYRPRRLVMRLGLIMATVLILVLFSYAYWTANELRQQERERVEQQATLLAHTVAAATLSHALTRNYAELESSLQRFVAFPEVRSIMLTDSHGKPYADVVRLANNHIEPRYDRHPQGVPQDPAKEIVSAGEQDMLLVWHPLLQGSHIGWIRLEYSTQSVQAASASAWKNTQQIGLLALFLIALGLVVSLAGPIRALRRAAAFATTLDSPHGHVLPDYHGALEIEQLYQALNEASQRLTDNERTLRLHASVFDSTREGVLITDAQQHIIQVNTAFTEISGYRAEEVIGKTPAILRSGRHDEAFYASLWRSLAARGYWSGEIWNRRKSGEIYAERLSISVVRDDEGLITHYVGVFGDITNLKNTEHRLEQLAHYDRLTGLPNRSLLMERMEQTLARCRRNGRLFAVAFLDLDGFKPVNDAWGHEVGDRLLVQLASRLGKVVRDSDMVARLGGDEFVLLLEEVNGGDEINPSLVRVLAALAQPYQIEGHELVVTASIGVAIYPEDGSTFSELLHHADQAMYAAKTAGANTYRRYGEIVNASRF